MNWSLIGYIYIHIPRRVVGQVQLVAMCAVDERFDHSRESPTLRCSLANTHYDFTGDLTETPLGPVKAKATYAVPRVGEAP